MATNFPDTSGNNTATGVLWAEGDSYFDPETGLTYYWYPPVWKTGFSPSGTTDDKYVEVAGDTMTGSLALNDKITLDATTGSANFAGTVVSGGDPNVQANNGVELNPAGYFFARRGSTDSIFLGGDTNAAGANVAIYGNGTAFFGGDINGGSPAISLESNGTGTFAGNVNAQAAIDINKGGSKDGNNAALVVWNTSGSTDSVNIKGNGNATFAGSVETGTFTATRGDGARTPVLQTSGSGNVVIGDASQIVLANGGSGTFAGVITQGGYDSGSATGQGSYIGAGTVVSQQPAGNTTSPVFQGRLGSGTPTSQINANGAATFTTVNGASVILNLEPDNDANYTATTEEYTETETYEGPRGNTLEREVTKTREIRTYTGPTLDVKAVIQDLQQRVNDRDAVIADLTTRIAALEAA